MQLKLRDLMMATTLVAVHAGLTSMAYTDLAAASATKPIYLILVVAVVLVASTLQRWARRNAGPLIAVIPPEKNWWLPVWLSLAVIDADLIWASIGLGPPLGLGLARHGLLLYAVMAWRDVASIVFAERGISVYGQVLAWNELRCRLQQDEVGWWLVVECTTDGQPLDARFRVADDLRRALQEARGKAALLKPSTAMQ